MTKIQSELLEKRIAELKHKSILLTKKIVKKDFALLNGVIFLGELDCPHFKLHSKKKMLGIYGYQAPDLVGLRRKFSDGYLYLSVLAHEMVHMWQDENCPDSRTHGKKFLSWIPTFNALGLTLSKTLSKKTIYKLEKNND